MTRRAIQRRTSPVSLFSFLDILGGTVGVLTLIIAVFLIQMGQGKQIVQLPIQAFCQWCQAICPG